ncbi:saccharopine dehydrogenase family protein [Novispirillum itersonii]|uniref:Saccharopine dehydrogenase-like NADP-dependent oxidoreductase n=1 Tax=Novispirillum itersonii TaxID=189 RepID=A0A7X0DMQ3_NOVIT|nr:saccharopine dehydrogenase family protein [Novispirillum itersonii]MBB6209432.1 saccharopine dehydrogenase-like NADP-dependent oxidoreductase [Novispirillum itersonii]
MRDILLLGGGKIGETIVDLLTATGDYAVTIADQNDAALARLPQRPNMKTLVLNAADTEALRAAMKGRFAVLSALPYTLTIEVARAARDLGVHYLDLTEDVASTRAVKQFAVEGTSTFIPQCGLAPGFISVVAHDVASRYDTLDSVKMRVGALPVYPHNALKYNLTWSTDGLINEYLEPCEAVVDGEKVLVPPLEELEHLSLDGVEYEAFNTSGGLGTLCDTLSGKVRTLNYRSIRYPGHRDIMKVLLQDLRLGERRDVLKDIMERSIPATPQDVIVIFVTVSGYRNGRLLQESYANKVYGRMVGDTFRSGIQITTAAGICTMLDLLHEGKLPSRGFVKQEDVDLATFLSNRFGKVYAQNEGGAAAGVGAGSKAA